MWLSWIFTHTSTIKTPKKPPPPPTRTHTQTHNNTLSHGKQVCVVLLCFLHKFPLGQAHTWRLSYTPNSLTHTNGTDKPQSNPLSFADIYFTLFIVLYVKIIEGSVLQHVDLREHLHQPLSLLVRLRLLASPPNQNHIDPGFERRIPSSDLHTCGNELSGCLQCWAGARLITVPY